MKYSLNKIATNLLWIFTVISLTGCGTPKPSPLTIATAASMQFPVQALIRDFEVQTGIPCNMVVGSSGKLTAQIIAGAPYDVFISADKKYPQEVYDKNKALRPPKIYARGELVLWTTSNDIPLVPDSLLSEKIHHIAVANPKIAPYGAAAIAALKHYGLFHRIKHKLVFGESIAQVNQFIISNTAEVGFTAKSVVLSPKMKNTGRWTAIDKKAYPAIEQGVVALKSTPDKEKEALLFIDFLLEMNPK